MEATPRSPPALMEELVEEILLRFPPSEPASLVRAALVCKRWACLISGPAFRRRFRELHRAPPMLGLLCNGLGDPYYGGADWCSFVPTAAFRPAPQAEHSSWRAVDSRHGRVLLRHREVFKDGGLVVWDPITDEKRKLPILPRHTSTWNAAVLCSPGAGACDHLDCHRGPFLVILVSSHTEEIFIYTYSSSADMWSGPISTPHPDPDGDCIHPLMPNALVGNALYFGFLTKTRALKYDLDLQEISVIGLPPKNSGWRRAVLTATEGGGRSQPQRAVGWDLSPYTSPNSACGRGKLALKWMMDGYETEPLTLRCCYLMMPS
ncbi:unnamed protein product [Urochloa decumbens]|uniref:F-box domain-containing protein n=1 Tax=Urochloa decumbens TaxID=240449 RepID=A0ABC9FNB0_9POAL